MRQLVYKDFISNNYPPFCFWRDIKLVTYQKYSKILWPTIVLMEILSWKTLREAFPLKKDIIRRQRRYGTIINSPKAIVLRRNEIGDKDGNLSPQYSFSPIVL